MFHGLLDVPVWGLIAITLVLTHITIVSVTVFLHRNQAHRSLELHPISSHFFRFWLWLTTGMVTKEWVAVHRKHHAKVETEEDPHSPKIHGINQILWNGVYYYRKETLNPQTMKDWGHGTPNDRIEKLLYDRPVVKNLGIVFMLVIDLLLFGFIAGPIVWLVQMIWIPFFAAGVINGVGHWGGYRNFKTPDTSTNIVPWGIIIGGEELHNNHHAYASSAKFSSKPWEFDIGWLWIRLMQMVGLAQVKRVAPKPVTDPSKGQVDMDTVKAIITHRFQVLSSYSKKVMQPVLKKEIYQRDLIKRCRRLLMKDESLMDAKSKAQLQSVMKTSEQLSTVYRFKLALQDIWHRSTQTQDQLIQALQDWCQQAEQTGIKALQDFAQTLRSYTVMPDKGATA